MIGEGGTLPESPGRFLDSPWPRSQNRMAVRDIPPSSGVFLRPPSLMPPMPLNQIGRYEITGTLGLGAMGVVYKAHDPLIERTVAIKTVGRAGLSRQETEEFEQRFFREAKSAGRLNHPNIVTIHDIGRSDDQAYIAMEYLDGRSLRDILDSGIVLPARRIAEIVADIADGLAFAHANGVVHRDIKPANIMVLDNGTAKIADFGVALVPGGSATLAGRAFGSPKYMSPEQIAGEKTDGRSDIFSLGAVLYEMLTGQPPFTGESVIAILNQVLTYGTPPLPSRRNPGLAAGFDRIVGRALARDPAGRYQNAAEMAGDLRRLWGIPGPVQRESDGDGAVRSGPPAAGAMYDPDATLQISVAAPPEILAGIAAELRREHPVAEPARQGQGTDHAPPGAAPLPAGGHDADATLLVDAVPPPKNRPPGLLRYGVGLAALALLAGVVLLRPASPPAPADTGLKTAVPVPLAPGGDVQGAGRPGTAEARPESNGERAVAPPATVAAPPRPIDGRPAPSAVAEGKADKAKSAASGSGKKPPPESVDLKPATETSVNWRTAMRADLAACEQKTFFQRIYCLEKARWKHCPGHWGSVEECPPGPREGG